MTPGRFKALAEVAAAMLEVIDTSQRYGSLSPSVRDSMRRRLNDALHPDYHVDRYGGLTEGVPYVNDAETERQAE